MKPQLDNVVEDKTDYVKKFKILLHNDDHNSFEHVIKTLCEIFKYENNVAAKMAMEVHTNGLCIVKDDLSQEHAEFYRDQLIAKSLSSTIEPQ